MIVKISGSGKSFKGLSDYLTHDPKAKTDERVAWTHTHNLANDDVPSAVNEMYLTAENAELLKQEAGVRAGGRATENPVKHISLNWAPDENPSREHMTETGDGFLRHMGWNEHQAVLIAHDDKSYRHVHIMLNTVHPETGLRLDESFEQRRAQKWALGYEREQGRIYCAQRELSPEERERNMPRNIWKEFQANEKEFQRAEKSRNENSEKSSEIRANPKDAEWEILKEFHEAERKDHFARGKFEFTELRKSIYREVREEFREKWADYYNAVKNRTDDDREILANRKAELIAEQKSVLGPRRDEACNQLRQSRDGRYQDILDRQGEDRAALRWRRDAGLDNAPFLSALEERKPSGQALGLGFREAAREVGSAARSAGTERDVRDSDDHRGGSASPARNEGLGGRSGSAAYSVANALFMAFLGETPAPPASPHEKEDMFREAAENTLKQQQRHARQEDDEQWRARQKALYGE